MRAWRQTHTLSAEERVRDISRSYAGVYKRRGKIIPRSCETCGSPDAEMHHPDYGLPLAVVWLCRTCHEALHREAAA